jgi:hypothetical protein
MKRAASSPTLSPRKAAFVVSMLLETRLVMFFLVAVAIAEGAKGGWR